MKFKGLEIPKITPLELQKRIEKFDNAFSEQLPEIERKLEMAIGENKKQIQEFKNDILEMKKITDKIKKLRNEKGIKGKFKLTKFFMVESRKGMIFSLKMLNKWKKYKGDIKNFPV